MRRAAMMVLVAGCVAEPVAPAPVAPVELALLGEVRLRGGARVVRVEPRIGGVPVHHGERRFLYRADGSLAGVVGAPVAAAPPPRFWIDEAAAIAAAGPGEAHVRRVVTRWGRAAYRVELVDAGWRVLVAADDGAVLERVDLVADDAFGYRVWADAETARPLDGPHADVQPHPTGVPDAHVPAAVASAQVAVESLVSTGDPWLPAGATQTAGNNVDAYVDLVAPDGYSEGDFRAEVTAPGVFDHAYDLGVGPLDAPAQQQASIVAIFYAVNWLHDWFYDSGFTEAAGNAQASNYGRGGLEGDAIRAEAQDNALGGNPGPTPDRNNANMMTPSDGVAPRMQMYLWSGPDQRRVEVAGAAPLFAGSAAGFGPQVFDQAAPLARLDPPDGCTAPTGDLTGRIALVDRGNCTFVLKTQLAEAAGAVGILIANNVAGMPAPQMGGSDDAIAIPVLSITMAAGADLVARLDDGPVDARMVREAATELDGSFDTGIVAHEWGHYLHHRLSICESYLCDALSEGWADFVALHAALEAGDDWTGVFTVGPYATRGYAYPDATYFGIRRYPYSIDPARSPLTFRHVQRGEPLPPATEVARSGNGSSDNAEVHNAGEIWAAALWEVYVALLEAHGYDQARRRISDYAVAGLLMTPVDPTFTEARDAILLAVRALEPADLARVAGGFAARGLGSCAVSPPARSLDLVGVVERFEVSGQIVASPPAIDDDLVGCDGDGYLDPGEVGTVRLVVSNRGALPLADLSVAASSGTAGVDVLEAATLPVLAPFEELAVALPVRIDPAVAPHSRLGLTVTATARGGCEAAVTITLDDPLGVDETVATSATESVEVRAPPWTPDGDPGDLWGRVDDGAGDHVLHGAAHDTYADSYLISPALEVGDQPFVVRLEHAYRFEPERDGGVIEVSTDGGASWADAPVAYPGAISDCCSNPLAGRAAFVGESPGFPARAPLVIDFGTALAGETVRLRFRIGSDVRTGDHGWDVDDLEFAGITNTPFGELVDEAGGCAAPPPDAGGLDADPDAGARPDAGEDPPLTGGGAACGCRGGGRGRAILVLLLVPLLLRRRR